mmetsp:Transcript_26698/g.43890  ORF Transcript_26698/g.43890 Transcript_26698/m.43890 type:complete len:121 (-) Transcript_26698:15-377(-)
MVRRELTSMRLEFGKYQTRTTSSFCIQEQGFHQLGICLWKEAKVVFLGFSFRHRSWLSLRRDDLANGSSKLATCTFFSRSNDVASGLHVVPHFLCYFLSFDVSVWADCIDLRLLGKLKTA